MGQIIDFSKKNTKKKNVLEGMRLIRLLPKLRNLKGETIVIYIDEKIMQDDKLLSKLTQEIAILKCMETFVVLVPEINTQIKIFCNEVLNVKEPFDVESFKETTEQIDVLDVILRHEVFDKVSLFLKNFGIMSIGMSGHDLDITFPSELANNNNMLSFFKKKNNDACCDYNKSRRKYSIDTLEELLKTNIVPIVGSTFRDRNRHIYVSESVFFGATLSGYLSSLKYVELYLDEQDIPRNCIYGIERFSKILKTGCFSKKSRQLINFGIEAIKNGVQGTHIIDIQQTNLLEEFCNGIFEGMFLYDDNLNHI